MSMATDQMTLMTEVWSYCPDQGPHPHTTKQLKWPWGNRGIWECPLPFTIPVSGKEANARPTWDSVLFGNSSYLDQRQRNSTTPPHAWEAPVVEDMLWDGKSGLKEVAVTGPIWAILFYRKQSLEWLSLGKAWYTTFMLSGAISWVGKQAQLNANPVSLSEGWQLIAPSHYQMTHWTKRTWMSSLHSTCITTI